jgi:hypothetical protein
VLKGTVAKWIFLDVIPAKAGIHEIILSVAVATEGYWFYLILKARFFPRQ